MTRPIYDAERRALAGRADLVRQTLAEGLGCKPEELEKAWRAYQAKRRKAKKSKK
jgi:hypothetical protein